MNIAVTIALLALLAVPASAAEYLDQVRSEVVQTPGSAAVLAKRASTCAARTLAPGVQGGNIILSSDDSGVVANNVLRYQAGMLTWDLRSKVAIETRDGRFRITHTNIERFNNQGRGWAGVGKWTGSGWQGAEDALNRVSRELSRCMTQTGTADDF